MDHLELDTAADWREWLVRNHRSSTEVWLVLRKGKGRGSSLTMKEAVGEAVCFGWIDSRTKRLDDQRYLLRFTPRKNDSGWSPRNLIWSKELIDQGRMTEAGLSRLPPDFRDRTARITEVEEELTYPVPELEAVLKDDPDLSAKYARFAEGQGKEFNRWILGAKRPETRLRRVERTLELIDLERSLTEDMMGRWAKK
jgi:uncharacterized protein YdeI (YjbR/CyaY-like superfamily)